ncbi:aspartate/glutamate racemase family protein [Pseudogemmobacter sp. W21_MBD1_M6]|uniref:aspartate/glutamate racemase family protein n=1 Tax=Pseudogemmobacter sp. W21_MBD1_M6 TaxID=3240271 RepID=UPI003F9C1EDF
MAPRVVGILGGMGPAATVDLMTRLVRAVDAADDADHVPLIVDSNTQVPSRIAALIDGTGADPAPVLVAMAERLRAAGAEALAMACNTAHHYADEIDLAVDIPFLDMVRLSADRASEMTTGKVGIIGSPALRKTRLFDEPLARAGRVAAYPVDEDALLAAIRGLKIAGASDAARDALRRASADLADQGAVVQLIACTEFSLVAEAVDPRATAVDTMDVLVDAIVRFSKG